MIVKKLTEGISYDEVTNSYNISFQNDSKSDIINLMAPEIYEAEFLGNVYYFGYKFKDSVPSKIRSDFIHWLKGLKETKPTDYQYREIIAKPLRVLDKLIGLKNFSLFVYPVSNRSTLVQKIIETCGMMMQRDLRGISVEMVKNLPLMVQFDWNRFDKEFNGDNHQKTQIYTYIENELMPKIHSLDYFSIAQNVKPKYRQYITDYLISGSGYEKDLMYLVQSNKILLVDDVNTTGATLSEIIRIIRNINVKAEIYVFTLLGT